MLFRLNSVHEHWYWCPPRHLPFLDMGWDKFSLCLCWSRRRWLPAEKMCVQMINLLGEDPNTDPNSQRIHKLLISPMAMTIQSLVLLIWSRSSSQAPAASMRHKFNRLNLGPNEFKTELTLSSFPMEIFDQWTGRSVKTAEVSNNWYWPWWTPVERNCLPCKISTGSSFLHYHHQHQNCIPSQCWIPLKPSAFNFSVFRSSYNGINIILVKAFLHNS